MADSTFAEHVATTNSRLASLRTNLVDASTFPEACSELTKWCEDQRAFTAHFEENLMLALEVAMKNGTKENYDFNLTHGLVAACFTHRKHLSKASATQIARWYEQMRRLKKNGGKRKRAPPKSKETANSQSNGALPGITSPCPPNGGHATENNNFMFSPSSDGSMWAPGVPMSAPGSSGHMPPGATPFPGPMNPSQQQHPGMHYGGQMQQLPYGQMEGNHAMYDHRMMAGRAAGRPGMMPDYPQMPMGQAPGNPMMRMPPQYPPGHPQMSGNGQYAQMIRAPPAAVYGQMNHGAQYPVTAHPNPNPQPQQLFILPEVRAIYEATIGLHVEREFIQEGLIALGNTGVEAMLTPDAYQLLETTDMDVLLSVWPVTKGSEESVQFGVYVNQQLVLSNTMRERAVCIKRYLKSGNNVLQFGYSNQAQMHKYSCDFVTKKHMGELRKMALSKKSQAEIPMMIQMQRSNYVQSAQKRQAGTLNVSLNCSLSKKRMFTPARHHDCKKSMFDLGQLIAQNKGKTRFYCQPCGNHFKFDDINVDYFVMSAINSVPLGINDIVVDRHGGCRPGEEETKKRGKKKNDDSTGAHPIKRIKSEVIVKQEPGMYPDMHGRLPFSPMTMPGSVPPDWTTRLQSPSFSMQSPNKIQLGPATPATPGMVFQNPASAGSMLNMSSPRQTMMPVSGHSMMPMQDPAMTMRSGSAPYTPESVKNDKNDELLMHIQLSDLYIHSTPNILENEQLVGRYIDGTKDDNFDDVPLYELEESPKHQPLDGVQTLTAPGSSSSSGSNFTPPFDDIHLGNRPSH